MSLTTDTNLEENAIVLSEEQQHAMEEFKKWYEEFPNTPRPFFVLQGFAGTGKSFTLSHILNTLGLKAQYMCYTGKAALVLRKYSGVEATTIHSAIYTYEGIRKHEYLDLEEKMNEASDAGDDGLHRELELELEEMKKPRFRLRDEHEAFSERKPDVLALDEVSMINEEMLVDLVSFGIPIIALGDAGQLEPVAGEGALFKGQPDAELTEIRRQALDSDIIKWSMWARQMRQLPTTHADDELEAQRLSLGSISARNPKGFVEYMKKNDMTICWRNVSRQELNRAFREDKGFAQDDPVYPVAGDTLIITANDKKEGVFNGLFCEVVEVGDLHEMYMDMQVLTEMGETKYLKIMRAHFEAYHDKDAVKRLKPWDFKGLHQADFGYAVTCHKAQGSQWDKVLVWDEDVFNWNKVAKERARWMYTAVTRAAKNVTIISGR